MSILLDPRTNDPIIDEYGSLEYSQQATRTALQHLQVWLHTGTTTEVMDPEYGFNVREVLMGAGRWRREFGLMQMVGPYIEKAVEELKDFIRNITVDEVYMDGTRLVIKMRVQPLSGEPGNMTVELE